MKDAFGVGHAQLVADDVAREEVEVATDFRADAKAWPTLFICVVSVGSAYGNFSKAKRGILVTT